MSKNEEALELPIVGGIYRHWKQGDLYLIASVKGMGADGIKKVYYQPLYPCEFDMFDRPLDDFLVAVPHPSGDGEIGRFVLVDHPPARAVLGKHSTALRTAADLAKRPLDLPHVRCANPDCRYQDSRRNERHLCTDSLCPIPGTPGNKRFSAE